MITTDDGSVMREAKALRRLTAGLCALVISGCTPVPPDPPDIRSVPGLYFSPRLSPLTADAAGAATAARAAARASACLKPLEALCGDIPCPRYRQSAAEARRYGNDPHCLISHVGTCGDLRFTRTGNGLASETEYFNAAGELVAARQHTDFGPSCRSGTHYGIRLTCGEVVTTSYCPNEARAVEFFRRLMPLSSR